MIKKTLRYIMARTTWHTYRHTSHIHRYTGHTHCHTRHTTPLPTGEGEEPQRGEGERLHHREGERLHYHEGERLHPHKGERLFSLRLFAALALFALLLGSCARMGQPDGGWYDETPPHVIAATPADRGVNVGTKKVTIFFDEYIKLENASEKVVVSPPQLEQPEIKTAGKRIEVKLVDSLKANTTYTIDFSDAITDNNESNPLGNYTYSFATGPQIDTLEVAGTVLQADNLEPVKGTLVGLYAQLEDSCFTTMPMLRVARTDSRGRFIIRGVAPGTYRVYALADADGNYLFSQKSEQIAFSRDTIAPYVTDATRQDTIWQDSLRIKDIKRVGYRRFMPDNIVLRAFNETMTDRYLIKSERAEANNFKLYFSYGDSIMPEIEGLNFDAADAFITETSPRRDTITYWLRDTALVNRDTLDIRLTYNMTDSVGQLVTQTDTLQLLSRQPYERRMKDLRKEVEEWQKKQEKLKKKGEPYDSIMPAKSLEINLNAPSELAPDRNIRFSFKTPLANVDTSLIHLYAKHDTLWYNARFELMLPESNRLDTAAATTPASLALHREYVLRGEWRPDVEYSLEIDSMAFTDIYGLHSPKIKKGFKVPSLDTYGTLMLNIGGMDGQRCVVQLLDSNDKTVKEAVTSADGTAQFFYLREGTYYARLFVDTNGNGRWDTGDYATGTQPEEVYYFHEPIECKAKWDITRSWFPKQRDLDKQKPAVITKQKSDKQKTIQQRNIQSAQKLGIPPPETKPFYNK